jgi:hypothetical protein
MLHEFANHVFQLFERLAVGQAILEMLGERAAHHHSVGQSVNNLRHEAGGLQVNHDKHNPPQ